MVKINVWKKICIFFKGIYQLTPVPEMIEYEGSVLTSSASTIRDVMSHNQLEFHIFNPNFLSYMENSKKNLLVID